MNLSTKARVGALAVALAASGAGAVALAVPAAAAVGCQVTYTTNEWTSSPGQGGFTANLALDDFLREPNMLVDTRNGEPISPEHGWPVRLFVPQLSPFTTAVAPRHASAMVTVRISGLLPSSRYSARRNGRPPPSKCSHA